MGALKLTIGQLAKQIGTTIRTLRYYDHIDLLKPSEYKDGGHRLYNVEDVRRLQQIQSLKFIGFSLKDISTLLEQGDVKQTDILTSIDFKRKELLAQKEEIQAMIKQLDRMDAVIADQKKIDIRVFCFIIHAIIFEEKHLTSNNKESFLNEERLELDKKYFQLFTEMKSLVSDKTNPSSPKAQNLIKKILQETKDVHQTIKRKDINIDSIPGDLLDPFTTQDHQFLEEARLVYLNSLK
jgi:DNA-binding transcriptional MerR regulator